VSAYLDHAATSPLRPEVRAAMDDVHDRRLGNPSGAHRLARAARRVLDDARESLAESVGCHPGEVVFTSGGTEADNLAVLGFDGPVSCRATEHHAVLDAVRAAGGTVVGADEPLPARGLASVMAVNNETGVVSSLDGIDAEVLHTDAVQALRWLDLRSFAAPADLVSISAHKVGGPVGTGALVVRSRVAGRVRPRQLGGGQERERRAGTNDVAGAVGLAAAAALAVAEREAACARVAALRDRLVAGLGLPVTAGDRERVPGILHVCAEGVDSEALLFLLDDAGVCASAAASCASGAQQASHVLAAMGVDPALARGSLRLSLAPSTTDAEITHALSVIPEAITHLREAVRS
jgi:cysteine desulfurase